MSDEDNQWERVIRWRTGCVTASARALREGRRKDTARVLSDLWRMSDCLAFHCTANPDRATGFVVETARSLLDGLIEEIESEAEKAARDADDDGEAVR